jgi:hypothetical protein
VEDKALDAYHRERSEIRDLVQQDVKVSGPLEAIIPQAQQVYAMALDDYNRSVPVEGATGETPRAWYNRTRAQWIGHVTRAAGTRLQEIDRTVRFKTPEALNGARDQYLQADGQLSPAFYDQVRLLKQADDIRREMQRIQGLPTQDKPAGQSSATPGKSLGFTNP